MDFIYFFRVLFKRKWIILAAGLIAATVAYLLTRNDIKYYKSTTQITTGFTIKYAVGVGDEENLSFFEEENMFNNVILMAKSDPVINLLSYKLMLHDLRGPKPFRTPNEQQRNSEIYKELQNNKQKYIDAFTDKLDHMIALTAYIPEDRNLISLLKQYKYDNKSLLQNLRVGRLQRTDYLQIEFLSESPELSAFVVNSVYDQFLRYYISIRDTRSAESIDTLRSIVDKKKATLDYKRSLLTGEGVVNVELESTGSMERITNLEKTLTDERTRLTKLYYELRKVNQKLGGGDGITPVDGENTDPVTATSPNQNNELYLLKKAMNETYEAYINSGSTDKSLLNKYNQLKAEYQDKFAAANIRSSNDASLPNNRQDLLEKKSDLEFDIKACEENITSLQSRINMIKSTSVQDASKAANIETLIKEVELANKEYLDAKQRYTEAVDVSTSHVNNFRQIIVGQPAMEPEPSKKILVLGMAGVAAMLAAILVIVLLTYLDSSVKTPGIFSKVVGLKLISIINFMNLKNKSLHDLVANTESGNSRKEQKGGNIFRENLRKLRYEIERSGRKIFLFTSTKKSEGKTTLIQALSFSMSLSKKKVLIIDSNFSNNDLTVQLQAEPVLEKLEMEPTNGYHSISEKVKYMSTEVAVSSVFVIGSEGGDYTPSEIFPHGNILQRLQELKSEYDYIFLEGPPLNDFTDSKELAQYVEGVIGVFSADHIIKQIDKESIQFFKELGNKFVGSVLNKVEMENLNVS